MGITQQHKTTGRVVSDKGLHFYSTKKKGSNKIKNKKALLINILWKTKKNLRWTQWKNMGEYVITSRMVGCPPTIVLPEELGSWRTQLQDATDQALTLI